MDNNYICMRCKVTGTKKDIPYRIIDNRDEKIRFKGQLCNKCFDEIFGGAPKTDSTETKEN